MAVNSDVFGNNRQRTYNLWYQPGDPSYFDKTGSSFDTIIIMLPFLQCCYTYHIDNSAYYIPTFKAHLCIFIGSYPEWLALIRDFLNIDIIVDDGNFRFSITASVSPTSFY
jgi:hypothetical protein